MDKKILEELEEWITHPDNEYSTDKVKEAFYILASAITRFNKEMVKDE